MRMTVRYEDGSVEEFDTGTLTTEGALGRPNAFTDINATIGDGVWADVSWYRVPTDRPGEVASRQPGCRVHLLNAEELSRTRSIEVDGRLQWLRVGDGLCDIARLDEVSDLMHEGPSACIAGRAVWLHDTLMQALPASRESHELVCAMLGLTPSSYVFLSEVFDFSSPEEQSFPCPDVKIP